MNSMIELNNNKHTKPDFTGLKSVLACTSKDPTRHVLSKVLIETDGDDGITITATDGRRMRSDRFNLEAEPGLYDIKVNSAKAIFLTRCQEELTFPSYRQVIPNHTDDAAYTLNGNGKQFVLRACAGLGCWVDPKLVQLGDDEAVTLHIQKIDPKRSPVLVTNETTTLVVMPMMLDHYWIQQLEAIQQERMLQAMKEKEERIAA
ncbi:hypothetical protein PDESU_01958 [Pontiella desulfatans]|uniref:DNA polymerase III subunit beta n=1 Tax=Pontiella desulfatans TaxID=2750659 RepID=A0A6C2U1D5_PONDE|nr:hypothetical protein [Pontiella desulfatans]VGO13401.1 hypothetical protein PDESU_01958 [Pontiella desulfatans]